MPTNTKVCSVVAGSDNSDKNMKNDSTILAKNFEEKIKELTATEQEAVKKFWRSVVMSTPRTFAEENGRLPSQYANVRSCNCCPYGYHIDLDFVRYCEALANAKPSEEELRRRSRRRSRKSMEFMLGLDTLFDQWDAIDRVQAVPEIPHENDSPDSAYPSHASTLQPTALTTSALHTSLPYSQRPRSSSVPRYAYGSARRSESPFGTASSTCSSLRGGIESDVPSYSIACKPLANSPPETRAFLKDALDEVCSDFERTLERASMRRRKASVSNGNGIGVSNSLGLLNYSLGYSDRNNNRSKPKINGYASIEKRNCHTWDHYFDVPDSCVSGNKSPRSSRVFSKSSLTLPPVPQKLSPGEQKYESYVQATVAANAKSPVELIAAAPPPPPRRHALTQSQTQTTKLTSSTTSIETSIIESTKTSLSEKTISLAPVLSPDATAAAAAAAAAASTDAQTLYNIRQQMALSLKRMKDLEEQVKAIPELQSELTQLRDEKQRLKQSLLRKDDELQRARETTRFSSTPSPVASPKNGGSTATSQFTPQRISPVSLESLGARLRTSSTSSEKQLKSLLKRDVSTMCGLHATRDIAVGSPVITLRTIGTSPAQALSITEMLYTQLELEERIQVAIRRYEEQRTLQQLKKLISVGTQMFVPNRESRDSGIQTITEKPVLKYTIGIMAKPNTRENFTTCKPNVRTVGSSEDRITDVLCEKCSAIRRTIGCNTEDAVAVAAAPAETDSSKAVSLKLLDMPGRSNTFCLGENEKLTVKHKTIGIQYTPIVTHSIGNQTSLALVKSVGIQNTPSIQNCSTQSYIDTASSYTDTRDLIRLCATQTSTEEIAPAVLAPVAPVLPPKPQTHTKGSNTDTRKTVDHGMNTLPSVSIRHSSSNTEEIRKRDIGCGDIVKPHISIACADNYCDSCKDAIKNLAKDFSKVLASPVQTRAVDSKIPRPKHLTSPSPVRRPFKRQNTYTITPSPSPSPSAEKKNLESSLHEKPPTLASFHQIESSSETQSFITEPIASEKVTTTTTTETTKQKSEESKNVHSQEAKTTTTTAATKPYELTKIGEDDLIVREETRVHISWSRDNSPASLNRKRDASPMKSLESSFNEKLKQSIEARISSSPTELSKGARKKTPSPTKTTTSHRQNENEETVSKESNIDNGNGNELEEKPPSTALLQKLAMVERKPREKITPPKEMLNALKIINDSLLKRLSAKSISSSSLKTSKATIQQEWFRISSTDKANPHEVEDYLDCFEELSVPLLEYCVNMMDINGNTAMHYAVSHGNFDVVSILLDSKVCNVNQMNNAGYTCVMLVSLAKLKNAAHRTVVERLFQMADVNIRAKKHCQTALMLAVSHGNQDMVEMLLAAGADINIQDEDGSTALMCAAEHGRVEIVKLLLSQSDCDSLMQDMDGSTAFKIAWQAGHRDIGLLLYVHEQMLRSKMPNRSDSQRTPNISPRQHKPQPPP